MEGPGNGQVGPWHAPVHGTVLPPRVKWQRPACPQGPLQKRRAGPASLPPTHRQKMASLLEVSDPCQPVKHALQAPTLGHHASHPVHFFFILFFI